MMPIKNLTNIELTSWYLNVGTLEIKKFKKIPSFSEGWEEPMVMNVIWCPPAVSPPVPDCIL